MRTGYPFTPAGFEAVQKELYALAQPELQAEADGAVIIKFKYI